MCFRFDDELLVVSPSMQGFKKLAGFVALSAGATVASATNPWADQVVSFSQGTGGAPGFTNASVTLGSPERFTGEGVFPGTVTPFASPFGSDEIVSIGVGGSLVVRFDEPVADDPFNPYGVDLLVFGNTFFFDPSFDPVATALFQPNGQIEISTDGVSWTLVPGVQPDGLFPTLGYLDELSAFGSATPGSVPSDFTKPVNPAFNWQGANLAQLIAGYDGSGGGAGVDIGALGFASISYVRVSLPAGVNGRVEIDAFSDVAPLPAPSAWCAAGGVFWILNRRRRRS